jgi:hypothetical protein
MTERRPSLQTSDRLAYLVTGVCFIVGLRYLSSPLTARLGNTHLDGRHGLALVATALDARLAASGGSSRSASVRRRGGRHLLGARRQDDGDAADGRALQRLRRRRGRHGRDGRIRATAPAALAAAARSGVRDRALRDHRLDQLRGQHRRIPEAARMMTGRPITYPGQQVVNGLDPARRDRRGSSCVETWRHRSSRWTPSGFSSARRRARARRALRAADRRRRHAGVISLLNSFTGLAGRADRLRPRQQRAHHQRRARRLRRERCSRC